MSRYTFVHGTRQQRTYHWVAWALFIGLSNLFAVYAPQVLREAIDLIADGIAQMKLPVDQRHLPVPDMLRVWVGWTGLDLEGRLQDLHDDDAVSNGFQLGYAGGVRGGHADKVTLGTQVVRCSHAGISRADNRYFHSGSPESSVGLCSQ